jgi:hypothetical protein
MPLTHVLIHETDGEPKPFVHHLQDGLQFIDVELGRDVLISLPGFDGLCATYARKLAQALTQAADTVEAQTQQRMVEQQL